MHILDNFKCHVGRRMQIHDMLIYRAEKKIPLCKYLITSAGLLVSSLDIALFLARFVLFQSVLDVCIMSNELCEDW